MRFSDRADAGRRLADALRAREFDDPVVVGLPRGGVPVAFEVATALNAPLDVIVVRKLGVPFQPELGMGAIGEGGVLVINDEVLRAAHLGAAALAEVQRRERAEVERRARRFRGERPAVPLAGRTVIVVDDGIATGSTARAACQVARAHGAARVVLAVPVGPPNVDARLRPDADEVVCLTTPSIFFAIGQFYDDFSQTSDEEVADLLRRACPPAPHDTEVAVPVDGGVGVQLPGRLTVPSGARGIVVFAHGSGSSRHSPRNRYVADTLNAAGLGTLLFDLLTVAEESRRANVFDIELLARRLTEVTRWLRGEPGTAGMQLAYFGASTGAAAALSAAAEAGSDVAAVVSRGGRPDLVGARLALVRAPTLLVVGGLDRLVVDLNRAAQARLSCESRLEVVPGAGHLFEEPGTLDTVARLARDWFSTHLTPLAHTAR